MTCLLRCSKAASASMPQPAGATRLSCISHHLPALKKCNICTCTPLPEATQNASRCPTYSRAPAAPKSLEFRFFSATAPIPACTRITTATLPFTRCPASHSLSSFVILIIIVTLFAAGGSRGPFGHCAAAAHSRRRSCRH